MKFYDKNGIMFDSGSNEKEKEKFVEEFLKQYSYDDKPLEAIEILDNMYKFGIVGYLPIGYSNKYYSWSYFPNATPNITKNLTFVIHKGIRKGLNI